MPKQLPNGEKLFKKVESLQRSLHRVLSEIEDAIPIGKADPKTRKEPIAFDDKRAVLMNLSKVTARTNREKSIILNEADRILEVFETVKKSNEYVVKELVVDVTKIVNELKKASDIEISTIENVQEIQKIFRYTVTSVANANKKIKEIEDKRRNLERKILDEKYFEELKRVEEEYNRGLQQLRDKYKVDTPEVQAQFREMQQKLDEEAQEIQQNASKIEKEAKDIIRKLRDTVKEIYDIPDRIIDEIKIYIKALGAIGSISPKKDSAVLTVKGIKKFFDDPEFRKYLEGNGWAMIQEQSDRVQIANSKFPDLGTYFSELKLKGEDIIGQLEKETEKRGGTKNEGVFTDAINKFIQSVYASGKKYFDKLVELYDTASSQFNNMMSETDKIILEFNTSHDTNMKELQKLYLGVQKSIKKAEIERISSVEKELK